MRSSDETQVDEEEAFFSLPCSPNDRPRQNRDPLAAIRESTCVTGETQMPVSGLTPPSTLDDALNPSKPPGTRKLGGFHGLDSTIRRHGYVDSTGEQSDDGASDDHSKGASPPPLHDGYLRRSCSGKDKRRPRETLVDGHQEDDVSIVNICSLA